MTTKGLPNWFKRDIPDSPTYKKVRDLLDDLNLNTVCKEAKCPNVGECYSRGTATFMILGNICTPNCGFCAIGLEKPRVVDAQEPQRLRDAVKTLGLKHVVITMVTRDDLKDGGAGHFAEVIREVKSLNQCSIEVLTSDFRGCHESVQEVVDAGPDIFNHNLETVERLHKAVRPMMTYERSLDVLKRAKEINGQVIIKSGIMLGLGESSEEVYQLLHDLRDIDCNVVTLGQYLKPTKGSLEVQRYVTPAEFDDYRRYGLNLGFQQVESGPLVRSSYMADKAVVLKEKALSNDKSE